MNEIKILFGNIGIDFFSPEIIQDNIMSDIEGHIKNNTIYPLSALNNKDKLGSFIEPKSIYKTEYSCYLGNQYYAKYNDEMYSTIKNNFKDYDLLSFVEACQVPIKDIFNDAKKIIFQDYTYPPTRYAIMLKDKVNTVFNEEHSSQKTKAFILLSDKIDIIMKKNNEHIFTKYYNYDYHPCLLQNCIQWYLPSNYCPNDKCLLETTNNNITVINRNGAKYPPMYNNIEATYIYDKTNNKYILVLAMHNQFNTSKDLEYLMKVLDKIVYNEDNVILCGDFNIANKKNGYNFKVQLRSKWEIKGELHFLDYWEILDLSDVYRFDSACVNKKKTRHMKLFYKLNNYNISLDKSKYDTCNLHFKTSSHILVPIILTIKNKVCKPVITDTKSLVGGLVRYKINYENIE